MKYLPEDFLTSSLKERSWGMKAARILAASLAAVDPGQVIQKNLFISGSELKVNSHTYDLSAYRRVYLLAIGKAAIPMALSTGTMLGSYLSRAYIITKTGSLEETTHTLPHTEIFYGSHPVPDQHSLNAAEHITQALSNLDEKDLVLVLISGGGSALLTKPAPGLTLEDLQLTTQLLLKSGASIQEINTIRKHLSAVKGGQLARIIHPASIITLILSDVVGDQLDQIASGPTVPDPTSFKDAMLILEKYHLKNSLPKAAQQYLERGCLGDHPETPKPGDPVFEKTLSCVLGCNLDAIRGGIIQAQVEGLKAAVWPEVIQGEASHMGASIMSALPGILDRRSPESGSWLFIAGGESTVRLTDTPWPGEGGRNLELALSTVRAISNYDQACLITLATDGEDGVTDAAGAVVTNKSYLHAADLNLDPDDHLARHDSYHFFKGLNDLIILGSTQTNVNDLCFIFIW
jgi:glycerate 2-kinase